MTARRTGEAFSSSLSWEVTGKNRRRPFTLSELGDYSEELSIIIFSQLGDDWWEELDKILRPVSSGRQLGRTEEDGSSCLSWEITRKNSRRPFALFQQGDDSEELNKTLHLASVERLQGRTEEDLTLPCRKNWRRPYFGLQEELKKTRHYLAGRTEEDASPCRSWEMTEKNRLKKTP